MFLLSKCFASKLRNVYLQHEHLWRNSSKNCRYLWEKYTHTFYGKIWKSCIVRLRKTLTCLENLSLDSYWVDNMTLCFWNPVVYFKKVSIWIVITSKIKFQFRHMCAIVSLARGLDIVQIGSLIVIQVINKRLNWNIFVGDYSYLNIQFTI